MTEKKVKLVFYERQRNEIVIDDIEAKEWDDFVIVYLAGDIIRELRESEPILKSLREYADRSGKEVIIVPEGSDISFYGVEVEGEQQPRSGKPCCSNDRCACRSRS